MARWQSKEPARDPEIRRNQRLIQACARRPSLTSNDPFISPIFHDRYRQGMNDGDQDFMTKLLDYVATECLPQGTRSRISHHLFKVRLVNKQFADAAAATFKTRLQDPSFDHYTVIIIPKQRPNVLCRALGPNSAFAGVATALELRLYRVWPSTISRASFVEKVVHAIECLQGDCTLIQQKLMTLYELNYVHAIDQESFLIDLHPSRRVATIRSLIRFLPESFTLSIIQPLITEELVGTSKDTDIDDWTLWHAFSYIDGWSVAYLHSDMRIVTDLIPSFPFHKTKNLTISTHGDCLPFEAGSPHLMVPQTSLSEARNLAAIRSLVIHWRSRDRNFMNDHWNHLLKRTPYLEQLTLEAPHAFDDEGWVGKVMNDVKLSYLESFAIVNLSTTVLELFTFFEAHKDALIEVHLIGERIQNGLPFFLFATKLARWSDHFTLTVTECEDRWEGNDEVMQKYGQYMKINTEVAGSPRDVSDFLV